MLASDSVKSGNQKVQVLRAVTFNLIGKGPPKVTLLKALSSFLTFFTQCAFQRSARFSHIPSLCGTDVGTWMVLSWLLECPVFVAFHTTPFPTSLVAPEGGGREQPRGGASSNFPGPEDLEAFYFTIFVFNHFIDIFEMQSYRHMTQSCSPPKWLQQARMGRVRILEPHPGFPGELAGSWIRSRPAVPQHWPQLDAFWRSRW